MPWAFDEEAVDVTREFAELKNRLMPYLWGCAVEAHRCGVPVMRPMLLEFPDDRTAASWTASTCSGRDLLVAPVFDDGGDVEFYVPAGRWVGLLDGQVVDGPGWVRQRHDFHSLPLLVRPGSVLAVGSRADRPDYDDAVAPDLRGVRPGRRRLDGQPPVRRARERAGVRARRARTAAEVVAEVRGRAGAAHRGMAPDLGRRTVRRTDRTDRRGGVRAGDARPRPRAEAAGIRDRMSRPRTSICCSQQHTLGLRGQCGPPRRRLVGETT